MVTSFTTGEKSVNFDQFAPIPFTLVFKLTKHFSPSSIRDRPSQLAVLNHVSNRQVFNDNQAIIPNQVCRQLVQKISTSIFNFGVYFSYFKSCFMSVTGVFGFPTQFLLRYFELVIQPIKMLGIGYLLSVTGTNQARDTSVEPNLFFSWWQSLNRVIIYQQRDEPTPRRVELDGNSIGRTSFGKLSRSNYVQRFGTLCQPHLTLSEFKSRRRGTHHHQNLLAGIRLCLELAQ